MGFICTVCGQILTMRQQEDGFPGGKLDILVATHCGHLFHQFCLNNRVSQQNSTLSLKRHKKNKLSCPTCLQALDTKQQFIRIYPTEDEAARKDSGDTLKKIENEDTQGNSSLIPESYQKLQLPQLEWEGCPMSRLQIVNVNYEDDDDTSTIALDYDYVSSSADDSSRWTRNGSGNTSEYASFVDDSKSHSTEDSFRAYFPQSKTPIYDNVHNLSHGNKGERGYRTIRRDFLTTRNRTTSWLAKLNMKASKLCAEEIVSDGSALEQQILETKLFLNKIESQGLLVDKLKEAADSFLTFDALDPLECQMTAKSAIELEKNYSQMYDSICERVTLLENAYQKYTDFCTFVKNTDKLVEYARERLREMDMENGDRQFKILETTRLHRQVRLHETQVEVIQETMTTFAQQENTKLLSCTARELKQVIENYEGVSKEIHERITGIVNTSSLFSKPVIVSEEPVQTPKLSKPMTMTMEESDPDEVWV